MTRRLLLVVLAWSALAVVRLEAETSCPGDCNADGRVSIDEVVRGVNIGTGALSLGACPAADENGDGLVRVDETVRAVAAGLSGCLPGTAGITPTPSGTPTPTTEPTCLSIAGRWILEERGSVTCTSSEIDGEQTATFEGEELVRISQNGCEVKYTAASVGLERSGTIDGSVVSLSGALLKSVSDLTLYENHVALQGFVIDDRIELQSDGRARGDINSGGDFLCAGASTAVFTRSE